jgi:hypothetical protein
MPCRHIVKYMILALAFGSCLTLHPSHGVGDGRRHFAFYAYA